MTTQAVDDTMLDEEWLAAPRERSRLTTVIAATLVAAVFFLAGSFTQKHLGEADAASGLPAGAPEGLSGFPTGGFPGAAPQGTQAPSSGTEPQTETETGSEDQVIGTVIEKKGDVWVVEDLGGKRHEVTVADDTDVVRESELTPAKVKAGDRVQITGVVRGDRLQAADITLR